MKTRLTFNAHFDGRGEVREVPDHLKPFVIPAIVQRCLSRRRP